jgi:hypothetical protein
MSKVMERFAAVVRIGDSQEHKTDPQVESVLRLHIDTSCWSSPPGHDIRPGTPVIASHIGIGLGRFLLGAFTGELLEEIPWPTRPEHADHVPHGVTWMDAVFVGDPDVIPGAKQRAFRWLSASEFSAALTEFVLRRDPPLPRGR